MAIPQSVSDAVSERVDWWINDAVYKPPEVLSGGLGVWYYYCMAKDIETYAIAKRNNVEHDFKWSASRLDPDWGLVNG